MLFIFILTIDPKYEYIEERVQVNALFFLFKFLLRLKI